MSLHTQIAALPDEAFGELRQWMQEQARQRAARPLVDAGQAEIITELRDAGTVTGPDAAADPTGDVPAWVDPGTIHPAMYLVGDHVTHQGRTWRSTYPGLNHWQPGAPGIDERIWLDVTPDDPEQPDDPDGPVEARPSEWTAGVSYQAGDRVIYRGVEYEVVQGHESAGHWTPDAVASLYTAV